MIEHTTFVCKNETHHLAQGGSATTVVSVASSGLAAHARWAKTLTGRKRNRKFLLTDLNHRPRHAGNCCGSELLVTRSTPELRRTRQCRFPNHYMIWCCAGWCVMAYAKNSRLMSCCFDLDWLTSEGVARTTRVVPTADAACPTAILRAGIVLCGSHQYFDSGLITSSRKI